MGSSVGFCCTFDLWNTFGVPNGYTNHTHKKLYNFLWSFSCFIIG